MSNLQATTSHSTDLYQYPTKSIHIGRPGNTKAWFYASSTSLTRYLGHSRRIWNPWTTPSSTKSYPDTFTGYCFDRDSCKDSKINGGWDNLGSITIRRLIQQLDLRRATNISISKSVFQIKWITRYHPRGLVLGIGRAADTITCISFPIFDTGMNHLILSSYRMFNIRTGQVNPRSLF